jgi:hypothetical protein
VREARITFFERLCCAAARSVRLRFELKLGYQQIGRSCSIGVSTVHKYLKRAEAAGLSWPLPQDWDEARVEAMVFPRREPSIAEHNPARTPPDFAAIHEQLRGSKYVTLQLLWEEYRQGNPEWMGLSIVRLAIRAEVRRLRHTAILFAWQDPAISRIPHGDFLTRSRLLTAAIISSTVVRTRHLFDDVGECSRAN